MVSKKISILLLNMMLFNEDDNNDDEDEVDVEYGDDEASVCSDVKNWLNREEIALAKVCVIKYCTATY